MFFKLIYKTVFLCSITFRVWYMIRNVKHVKSASDELNWSLQRFIWCDCSLLCGSVNTSNRSEPGWITVDPTYKSACIEISRWRCRHKLLGICILKVFQCLLLRVDHLKIWNLFFKNIGATGVSGTHPSNCSNWAEFWPEEVFGSTELKSDILRTLCPFLPLFQGGFPKPSGLFYRHNEIIFDK